MNYHQITTSTRASLDLVGRIVGRYRIVSLIGEGGMGEVYDAIDTSLGRHVALKILKVAADSTHLARFSQEARAASALNHPHLVSIYEIGEQEELHFIAMERVDGATLRHVLSMERVPVTRALDLIAQVADAVGAAHGAGIVHRDLKPENIMVASGGYAKVLDFGLAKLQPDVIPDDASTDTRLKATESGAILGTVGYMSPEQAQGKAADGRSDIFAIGCILYELIAGKRAFGGNTPIDTLHEIVHKEPPRLRDIAAAPAEVSRIVEKAMAKDPERRYQSARDMAIDLNNARREIESAAVRKRTSAWIYGAAAVALVAAAIAVILSSRRVAPKPPLHVQRMTHIGDVIQAAISPDGKYMAYIRSNDAGQSLWLRQLATNQDLPLIAPTREKRIWGVSFTPDSNTIFYVTKTTSMTKGQLSSMPAIGGRSERVLEGIDSSVSFSPDGKRLTYLCSDYPNRGESALFVASSDGNSPHPIAIRRPPESFSPIWFAAPSWSPDGKLIATAVVHLGDPPRGSIVAVDPDSGKEVVVATPSWEHVGRVIWLPDGRGLLAIAGSGTLHTVGPGQDDPIWLVPFPAGSPRQITSDIDLYRGLSASISGELLVTVQVGMTPAELWLVPSNRSAAEKVSIGVDLPPYVSYAGHGQFAFALNGSISAAQKTPGGGVHVVEVVHDRFQNSHPIGFEGGLVYSSLTPQGEEVCMASPADGGRRVIAKGAPVTMTRDGSRLIYVRDGLLSVRSLRDGSEAKLPLPPDTVANSISLSAAGDRMAIVYGHFPQQRVGIATTRDGKIVWSSAIRLFDLHRLHWMPDGSGVLVSGVTTDLSNIWKIDRQGQLTKITNFYGESILNFDVAPDGTLAVIRAGIDSDAVLMRGLR